MTEDKNRFPHDFYRWHDIRIDEYMTAKAIADEKERQKLYKSFAKVSEKYLPMFDPISFPFFILSIFVCWVGIAQKIAKEHQKYVNLARTFR